MNPLPAQEPPNGDFVAYLERLEAESAARHGAAGGAPAPRVPFGQNTPTPPRRPLDAAQADAVADALLQPATRRPASAPAPLNAEQARELLQRLGAGDIRIEQLIPGAAIAFGVLLIIANAIMGRGPVGFFIGVGLVIWGSKRLETIKKQSNRS